MIISKTPYRISLFGGSTDYPSFFQEFGSLLVGFTINKYVYILCRYTPGILTHHTAISYSKLEKVLNHQDILHDGVRGVLEYLNITDGVEINIHTDLPARTGIGSSSTFVVGLLNTLYKLTKQHQPSKKQLSNDAIYIERTLLKEVGGIQDQIWAAYGGTNSITINKDNTFQVCPLPVSEEFLDELLNHMILIYTGSQRHSFKIAQSHNTTVDNESHKQNILKIAHEGYDAFVHNDIYEIGKLLNESWQAKQQISPLISNDKINQLYNKALSVGAFGGKLLGSGGSGFLLFITQPDNKQNIIDSLDCESINFNFDHQGSQIVLDNNT